VNISKHVFLTYVKRLAFLTFLNKRHEFDTGAYNEAVARGITRVLHAPVISAAVAKPRSFMLK